ncbi:MAG TPA: hypothetical protein VGR08_13410 [Thermomicrobiales bacterium]|nr:hypothetical protein [Thermomicrobiales bacterium]
MGPTSLWRQGPVQGPLDRSGPGIAQFGAVRQTTRDLYRQIGPHLDLARQPGRFSALANLSQALFLSWGDRARRPIDNLDPARGTTRVSAAAMEDVDAGSFETQDEATTLGTDDIADSVDRNGRHEVELSFVVF